MQILFRESLKTPNWLSLLSLQTLAYESLLMLQPLSSISQQALSDKYTIHCTMQTLISTFSILGSLQLL